MTILMTDVSVTGDTGYKCPLCDRKVNKGIAAIRLDYGKKTKLIHRKCWRNRK